jgi:ligand-binding sensor domain-containing protein/serine phosphatase RsbU (regulator of sigma subunit)
MALDLPGFTIADGLSSNSVTALFQDNQGFLWVGTEDGLNRYDGYGFKVYRHNPENPHSISGNFIQVIAQDKDHNLWIGTRDGGLSKLDYKSGLFTTYLHHDNDDGSLPGNNVYGLLIDNRNRLWVKTEGHLSLFDGESSVFKSYGHYLNVFNLAQSNHYPLFLESDTSILLGTRDGLNRFNTATRQFSRFPFIGESIISGREPVQELLYLSVGRYLGATPSGLKLFDLEKPLAIDIPPSAYSHDMRGTVNDMLELSNGEIYLGTHKGLEVFDRSRLVHQLIRKDSRVLVPYHVTALIQDESGIIWIGTRFNGLLKLDLTPPKFKTLTRDQFSPDQLESVNFQSVFRDLEGQLWLGTLNRGIYRYRSSAHRPEHYIINSQRYYADNDAVNVLFEDFTGRLWAGTNSGLYYFIPPLNDFVEFHFQDNLEIETLLSDNEVFTLANDSAGSLWIGTQFGLYEYSQEGINSYFLDEGTGGGPSSNRVNALQLDNRGNLWIGTDHGIDVFDPRSRNFRQIQFEFGGATPSTIQVLSLSCDGKGGLLAGTRSGLWVIPSGSDTALFMRGNKNLPNDMINSVVADETHRAWVGTNKGVACINSGGVVFNFDTFDGLPGFVFNQGSVFKDRDGTLFFGGAEGLCWAHPDSINYNLNQPKMVITDMAIFKKGERVEELFGTKDTVTFKYRPNMALEVNFAALEFTYPAKNRFKVFLEGYDEDWRPVTRENKIIFSNLLPDDYVLKIMASNNDFTWNNKPLEMHVIVTPPLWMSNYAYAFYALIIIFVVQMLINYRVRHYKKMNRSLKEKTVDKKQIEAQREALSHINQSLTDSINYAKRIQSAMIPVEESLRSLFPSSFVYLRPRSIVSGDFYWFHQRGDKIFVAAVDCTGHGVPGAFMSIIGIALLKNLIEVQGLESPEEILKAMNEDLINTLHKQAQGKGGNNQVNDGMDIALMVIDRGQQTFEFAGALGGFYLVRDNQVHTFKGDRYPLGYLKDSVSPVFSKQQGTLNEGDVVYLFSDGFPDQFGGPDLKKFKYRRFRLLLLNIHRLAFADQKSILHQKLEEWMGTENEQVDDVLVMGFKPL